MSVVIPDDILQAARMSEAEFRLELAVMLFALDKLTLAQASRLAGLGRAEFQHLLGSRRIAPHYGVAELHEDVAALRDLGRL
jgi:predicted HTH domain antitoxin